MECFIIIIIILLLLLYYLYYYKLQRYLNELNSYTMVVVDSCPDSRG